MQNTTTWRPIPGFPGYEVTRGGRVRSVDRKVVDRLGRPRSLRGRERVQATNRHGYPVVGLRLGCRAKMVPVHALVLCTFVGPRPPGHHASHVDGDKSNNDAKNLVWETPSENEARKVTHGTSARGEHNHASKLTAADVVAIREALMNAPRKYGSGSAIARQYGVTRYLVSRIRLRKNWSHV